MTSHVIAPIIALVRRIREARKPAPIVPSFEGLQVPAHLVGKSFDIRDANGNLVAVVNKRRLDPDIARMIG